MTDGAREAEGGVKIWVMEQDIAQHTISYIPKIHSYRLDEFSWSPGKNTRTELEFSPKDLFKFVRILNKQVVICIARDPVARPTSTESRPDTFIISPQNTIS